MSNIELIDFDIVNKQGQVAASTCGFMLSERQGKPFIELFEVKENDGLYVVDNLFKAAPAIQRLLLPEHHITQIDWQITNGIYQSQVSFEETHGHVYKATFHDGFVNSAQHFSRPLEHYTEAMESPDGFESNMTGGQNLIRGTATSFIAVPVPFHSNEEVYFKRYDESKINGGYETILVKPNAFIKDWVKENSRSDRYIFTSNLETAVRYMRSDSLKEHTLDMAYMGYNEALGMGFVNGRHRTANVATLGAPYLPLDVSIVGDPEQIISFKEKYEWQGDNKPYRGLNREELNIAEEKNPTNITQSFYVPPQVS